MRTHPRNPSPHSRLTRAEQVFPAHGLFPLVSSRDLAWNGIAVDLHHSDMREVHHPPFDEHFISMALSPLQLTQVLDGRTMTASKRWGDVGLCPAGVETHWYFSGPYDVLLLRVQPAFVRQVAAEIDLRQPDQTELLNCLQRPDARLTHMLTALWSEVTAAGANGRLYADAFAQVAAVHLLEHYGARPPAPRRRRGGLTPTQLHRAFEYIHDNLRTDLALADLAHAARLSPYHFARLFRRATGLAPHQYVIRQRVEAAKVLLRSGRELSLAEVAAHVGFTDQSHLTRHCRRLLGVTPGRLRAEGAGHAERDSGKNSKILQDSPTLAGYDVGQDGRGRGMPPRTGGAYGRH